jgi:hypothetical protein
MNEERVSDPLAEEGDGGGPIPTGPREVTRLLAAWSGDRAALTELTRLVYQEPDASPITTWSDRLRSHAADDGARQRGVPASRKPGAAELANRSLAVAATAMRQILVDHAKASVRQKRGGGIRN